MLLPPQHIGSAYHLLRHTSSTDQQLAPCHVLPAHGLWISLNAAKSGSDGSFSARDLPLGCRLHTSVTLHAVEAAVS